MGGLGVSACWGPTWAPDGPPLLGRRHISIAHRRDLGGERYSGDTIGVVIPHPVHRRKILGILHPFLQHAGQIPHVPGVPRVVGQITKLPRVGHQVVEFQPRAWRLEQPPLGRRQKACPRPRTKRLKRGAAADVSCGAKWKRGVRIGADELETRGTDGALMLVAIVPVAFTENKWAAAYAAGSVSSGRRLRPSIALGRVPPATSRSVGARSSGGE